MSDNLYKLFTEEFSTNLELKLQQMGSKLRPLVTTGTHTGRQASPINQMSAISLRAPAGRFSPKNRTDADFTRRWVFPQDGEIDQLIDTFDELKTIVDPKSQYSTNAANAVGRAFDDALITAAFGTNYVGNGADNSSLTPETFDTTKYQININVGGTASGMNVAKMLEARRILQHNHVDLDSDPITMVIGSQQEQDLLKQVEVVSTEYNDRPVLVNGRVKQFLGFNIVVSERLPSVTTDTIRQCLVFAQSGMYLGIWKDMMNRVSIRNDLSGEPYDLYTSVSFGATRTQPGKVLQILCADTTGADITP